MARNLLNGTRAGCVGVVMLSEPYMSAMPASTLPPSGCGAVMNASPVKPFEVFGAEGEWRTGHRCHADQPINDRCRAVARSTCRIWYT